MTGTPAAGKGRSKLGVSVRGSRAGRRGQKQGWVGSGWACAWRPVCWPLLPPTGSAWNCGGAARFPDPRLAVFHTSPSSPSFLVVFLKKKLHIKKIKKKNKKLHIFNIVCVPKLRGWFVGVSSRLPMCGCWGSKLRPSVLQQAPLPAEPSYWPVRF